MQLSVVIPILNEEKTIEKIISKVLKQPMVSEIICVDDGSSDNTSRILKKLEKKNRKIKFFQHAKNLGKGAAIITALKHVSQNYLLIQDADLEYNPDEYSKLAKVATPKTVVYGSRMLAKNAHAYERTYLGNVILTGLCNLLFGTKLTDSYTCYKLMPTKIAKSLALKSPSFEIEAEITAKLARKKIAVKEVSISYSPRKYEQGKKIKAKDAAKGIAMLLAVRLGFI